MEYRTVTQTETYLARLETGADWRAEIELLAEVEGIEAGWFNGMGAVEDAVIWFYDQTEKAYAAVEFNESLEVAACVGNVSLLNGEIFAHTHVVLSRPDGETVAGHLDTATVFAGEVCLQAFAEPLVREFDETTELDLWL